MDISSAIYKLSSYFQFPFVRNALIVGVLISLCASILGVMLVLKHFSYIGDGLSHVAFGAIAIAAVVGM
ncbi:MAG: metal ABC transporter permease, partial [Spirochaetales bacterium]